VKNKVVLTLSGGADSAVLLYMAANKNIVGIKNVVNIKKSETLKKTWSEGRFKRKQFHHTNESKHSISERKKKFWLNAENKNKHVKKWLKIWSDPEYKKLRSSKVNNGWKAINELGEIIEIPNLALFCAKLGINYESCRVNFNRGTSYNGYTPID